LTVIAEATGRPVPIKPALPFRRLMLGHSQAFPERILEAVPCVLFLLLEDDER
jgi:hypothetical protein